MICSGQRIWKWNDRRENIINNNMNHDGERTAEPNWGLRRIW